MNAGILKNPVRLGAIQEFLKAMGIEFSTSGPDIECNKLCSIRKIEERGLYYITSDVADGHLPIEQSIIITDQLPRGMSGTNAYVLVDHPQLVFYRLCQLLAVIQSQRGTHPTAIVDPEATLADGLAIGAYCVIGKCEIGQDTSIHHHVTLYDNTVIGANVTVESGTCIGVTGMMWAWSSDGERVIQPQVGGVFIDNGCVIGSNISVARGSLNEDTYVGKNTIMAHGTKIGHGVHIGSYCHFANNVSVAGGAQIGTKCFLGSGSVVSSNVRVAPGTIVGAGAVVVQDIMEEGTAVVGVPAKKMGYASGRHKGVPWGPESSDGRKRSGKRRDTEKFIIIGAGGFAREVLDVFEACIEAGRNYEVLGYVVDSQYGPPGTLINEKPILGDFNWLQKRSSRPQVVCAVGNPLVRRQLTLKALNCGAHFGTIIHPSAVLTPHIDMGKGVIIGAGCIFTNNIRVGNHVHVNLACTVGHDAILDDFATLAPSVHVSGYVTIGEGCYIGTGATILERRKAGPWSLVGAGAVVVNDVPPHCTVVGVPAKVIKTRRAE